MLPTAERTPARAAPGGAVHSTGAHWRPKEPSDHHFNPYRLFRTLPPQGGNEIQLDPEWERFWDPDEPRYAPFTNG